MSLSFSRCRPADYFKEGPATGGPWTLPQTVYKYSAIAYDIMSTIKAVAPSLKLSTAAGAVGAWSGNWWGGNLKGLWYYTKQVSEMSSSHVSC
jgi:hypothetical protein